LEVKHRQLARKVGVFIEHPPENSMASFNFTSIVPDEGTTFIFSSWVYTANGLGGFHSHLANTKKPEASAPAPCRDIDDPVDEFGKIRFSDPIGNYASHLIAISCPLINAGDLVARIYQVDCNIAMCIKLTEAALRHPGNLSSLTQHCFEISHHPIACTGDIFFGIDRVYQDIAKCIKLAEATL
jgi:hypothetical protein